MTFPVVSLQDRQVAVAVDRAAAGRGLSREAAIHLLEPSAPLEPLLAAATALRDRGRGRIITYSRKVFLPLTNLCRDRCGYCTFRRDPGDPDGWVMTPEQVLAVVEEGARLGCTEALFSLGDAPEAVFLEARAILLRLGYRRTLEYLRAACALVLERSPLFPHANAGLMGEPDLLALKPVNASMGLMLESVSPRLLEPGGPHHGAVTKHPRARLRVMEIAGQLKIPFTTGLLIGIGETAEERVDSLLSIRALHERHGHIQEVIIQNFRAKPTIPMRGHPEPTLEEMLRTTAVARLILGPSMNLQAPPNLTQEYGRLLEAGINDWGGVSPLTRDFINPEASWPHLEALRGVTEDRGFLLRQRLPVYPEYILDRPEYLPPELAERIRASVDGDGLVPDNATANERK
ncbi:MAG: 7,8-didemethyl-8-hydroxy-5-deazariboflavin synthase CofG [candidate division NC10 bacterium]|nr:7,8-didemethyl-8-hydroxy-5-deazariboflavin synthase CofG [candidate division NC10 bacterium]